MSIAAGQVFTFFGRGRLIREFSVSRYRWSKGQCRDESWIALVNMNFWYIRWPGITLVKNIKHNTKIDKKNHESERIGLYNITFQNRNQLKLKIERVPSVVHLTQNYIEQLSLYKHHRTNFIVQTSQNEHHTTSIIELTS